MESAPASSSTPIAEINVTITSLQLANISWMVIVN